jgi:hypothetical protein
MEPESKILQTAFLGINGKFREMTANLCSPIGRDINASAQAASDSWQIPNGIEYRKRR